MGSIYQLFDASVERFAERPALIEPIEGGGMSSMTYGALQEQACCFAGYLQEQQIGKRDRVCIWAASCTNWMVAYLGALLVGAVVVPLDVNTKEDFLTRIAETTEAKLLVTTQKQYAGLKQPPLPLVDIEALPQGTLDATKLPTVNGDDLAELVFTSGTTSSHAPPPSACGIGAWLTTPKSAHQANLQGRAKRMWDRKKLTRLIL